jgi:isopentenyl-diphosphate delta-isomerase
VTEQVVLVDAGGQAIGTESKSVVHHSNTPLHLAFSAYLFRGGSDAADLLVTRRALDKRTFPGVWSNSVCGHPAPGERLSDAVRRRAAQELGLTVTDLRLVLPRFAYRAEMDGVVEHELCPVYVGVVEGEPSPDATEVWGYEWVPWAAYAGDVSEGRREVSTWSREQVAALLELGPDPSAWPTADPAGLPPACPPE